MTKPKKPAQPKLSVGTNVVCTNWRVESADAFTRLIVTEVHSDGTVDLKTDQDERRWEHVDVEDLFEIYC